nr:hypothetical protein [Halovivax ruber]
MSGDDTDPVQAANDERDLYGITTWEERSRLDSLSVGIFWLLVRTGQVIVVLLALATFIAIGGLSLFTDPAIGALTVASALPAVALAGYVWLSDATASEPLSLLAITFLLGVVTAGFAAVLNGILQPVFATLELVGMVLFFLPRRGPGRGDGKIARSPAIRLQR